MESWERRDLGPQAVASDSPMSHKLTVLWRAENAERDWFDEIFSPVIGDWAEGGEPDHCLVVDHYLHTKPANFYHRFRSRNAWLLHLSDETYEGGYAHYACFRGVFRNYWSGIFNPRRVMQIPLGYAVGLVRPPILVRDRPWLWSFLGDGNRGSRPNMLKAFRSLEPAYVHSTGGPAPKPRLGRPEYSQVVSDSIFVPCPMGNVNLDTFRVYEALECGAVPILEKRSTLDYFAELFGNHPLPTFLRWTDAAQAVALWRDNPEELERLRQTCMQWWSSYKTRLQSRIQEFLERTSLPESAPFVSSWHSVPGWRAGELLRHHSVGAIWRRASVMTSRIVRRQKLRRTAGR
jgi:hypothetical protein